MSERQELRRLALAAVLIVGGSRTGALVAQQDGQQGLDLTKPPVGVLIDLRSLAARAELPQGNAAFRRTAPEPFGARSLSAGFPPNGRGTPDAPAPRLSALDLASFSVLLPEGWTEAPLRRIAGRRHTVTIHGGQLRVEELAGGSAASLPLRAFWASLAGDEERCAPEESWLGHDEAGQRWALAQVCGAGGPDGALLLAVSRSEHPGELWYSYRLGLDGNRALRDAAPEVSLGRGTVRASVRLCAGDGADPCDAALSAGRPGSAMTFVLDRPGLESGMARPPAVNDSQQAAPASGALSPSSGTGPASLFSFSFSDPDGAGTITQALMLFNSSLDGRNACYVVYANGQLGLVNDAGTGSSFLGPGPGSIVENSRCVLNGSASVAYPSGNSLTVYLYLTFKAAFGGTKAVYAQAIDSSGMSSGWQVVGTWTVPTANLPPRPTSNFDSVEGVSLLWILNFVDPDGGSTITQALMLFNTAVDGRNACYVVYANGQLGLVNDAGTGSSFVTPGSSATVENSQCILSAGFSSVTVNSDMLSLAVNLTFKPAFAGTKNVYLQAVDRGGLSSGWQLKGAVRVP